MVIEPIHKNVPDAPFRSGVTGKYKLLIKSVTRKAFNYEYELMDADGNEYAAGHPKHYAEGEFLRCMVYFKIANAKLVVTETLICNKQDLTVAIPEEKKVRVLSKTAIKPSVKPKFVDDPRSVDSPRKEGKSGLYYLRVIDLEKKGDKYLYWVIDSDGCRYKVEALAKKSYSPGKVVVCNVRVSQVAREGGLTEIAVKVLMVTKRQTKEPKPPKKSKKKITHVKRSRSSYSSRDWLPVPCVGDHFRLIYTPMRNKR